MPRLPTIVVRQEMLNSWLTISECSKSRLASELGVSAGRVSQLLTSREEPSAHVMAKLMKITNMPFDKLFAIVHSMPHVPISKKTTRNSVRTPKSSTRIPVNSH